MHRILWGERVHQMIEVTAMSLAEALQETQNLVKPFEDDGHIFTITQEWDSIDENYVIYIFVR